MFNRVVTGVVGLAFALSLGACAGNNGAEGSTSPDESVESSTDNLVLAHIFDTFEGGNNNGVGYRNQYFNQAAINKLTSWGMPLAVEDYCINSGVNASCPSGWGGTWLRVKYPSGTWGSWKQSPTPSAYIAAGTQNNDPGGLIISCKRNPDNNWFCTAGTGGPGFSAYIESKYSP